MHFFTPQGIYNAVQLFCAIIHEGIKFMFLNFLFCICGHGTDGLCVVPTPGLKCVESMQVKSPRDKQVLRKLGDHCSYTIRDILQEPN